jgi:N-acetylglutamate synthase-like GNAT family acetyltransferase
MGEKLMSSYHFYEAKNEDTNEIFEILKNFEKEVEELNYPKVDNDKLKSRIFYFIEHGKILMVKNLDKNKLIGVSVIHNTEYLWSKENILNVQVIYVLPEYRSLEIFNNIMKIIKTQANKKAIHLSISTKLIASKLLERVGFEQMGGIWRMK